MGSESASKLETLQKIAMAASAAYRKHVDAINVSNEKRYATYVKKIATSRGAAMKRREERLVIIDKKIAVYKSKLQAGANKRLEVRRTIEAKKIAAIRAEYFRQLHAAQAAYDKSRVVENFNKKLDTYRHKVMNKKDESSEFRADLQKKILAKLETYRVNLQNLEAQEMSKFKLAMTKSATNLSKYTALYAAGRDVSSSRKAYWVKYANQLGLDKVSYQTTVVHHHHANKTVAVHHTHKHIIIVQGHRNSGMRVATGFGNKNLKVVTASHLPSLPHHETRFSNRSAARTVVVHHSSHSRTVSAIKSARHLVAKAKIAIIQAKAGKLSKSEATKAVAAAKSAVVAAHKRMLVVLKSKHAAAKTIVHHVGTLKKSMRRIVRAVHHRSTGRTITRSRRHRVY